MCSEADSRLWSHPTCWRYINKSIIIIIIIIVKVTPNMRSESTPVMPGRIFEPGKGLQTITTLFLFLILLLLLSDFRKIL